jgi:hypothetical protein
MYIGLIMAVDKPVVKTTNNNLRNRFDKGPLGLTEMDRGGCVSGTFFKTKPAPKIAIAAYPMKLTRQPIAVDKELTKAKPAKTPIISPRV